MYRVSQQIDFCYGHRLLNYSGKCRHLHGHNGKAVIVLEGRSLDDRGMLVDFTDIKRSLCSWIDGELDHRMILCEADPAIGPLKALGEPLLVIPSNPTAENIARLIFDHAQRKASQLRKCRFGKVRGRARLIGRKNSRPDLAEVGFRGHQRAAKKNDPRKRFRSKGLGRLIAIGELKAEWVKLLSGDLPQPEAFFASASSSGVRLGLKLLSL